MAYVDSPEVAAQRKAVEAHLEQVGRKYNRGLNLPLMRTDALIEYLIDLLGNRDDAELFFLDKIEQTLKEMEPEFAKGVLLGPAVGRQHVSPDELAALRQLGRGK